MRHRQGIRPAGCVVGIEQIEHVQTNLSLTGTELRHSITAATGTIGGIADRRSAGRSTTRIVDSGQASIRLAVIRNGREGAHFPFSRTPSQFLASRAPSMPTVATPTFIIILTTATVIIGRTDAVVHALLRRRALGGRRTDTLHIPRLNDLSGRMAEHTFRRSNKSETLRNVRPCAHIGTSLGATAGAVGGIADRRPAGRRAGRVGAMTENDIVGSGGFGQGASAGCAAGR